MRFHNPKTHLAKILVQQTDLKVWVGVILVHSEGLVDGVVRGIVEQVLRVRVPQVDARNADQTDEAGVIAARTKAQNPVTM